MLSVYKFNLQIYNLLTQDKALKEKIKGVFLSIQKDANYPYILINDIKTKSHSLHFSNEYEIEFNLLVFSRDSNPLNLTLIGENISKLMTADSFKSDSYKIISLKARNFEITQGHDLVTSKMIINFKAIIREI